MCRWRYSLGVVALFFTPLTAIFAQETSCIHRTLPVTVMDSSGRVIHGLLPSDFSVRIHGRPATVLSVSLDKRPHRTVVLLDASGSMVDRPLKGRPWELALKIASDIAESNSENAPLALIIYSDKVHEQVDFAQGTPEVRTRLKAISADPTYVKNNIKGSTTATFDAMLAALRLLGASDSSDSIYLISDGVDNQSRFKSKDVSRALGLRSVRMYVSLFESSTEGFGKVGEEASIEAMTKLTIDSGGLIIGPLGRNSPNGTKYDITNDQHKALTVALASVHGAMTDDELLQIELPQAIQKWERVSLELSADKKALHKYLVIAYPKELAPCNVLSH